MDKHVRAWKAMVFQGRNVGPIGMSTVIIYASVRRECLDISVGWKTMSQPPIRRPREFRAPLEIRPLGTERLVVYLFEDWSQRLGNNGNEVGTPRLTAAFLARI